MRPIVRRVCPILCIVPTLLVALAAPADASMRKCTHAPGSTSLYYPGSAPLLMVDGVAIGDMPASGDSSQGVLSYSTDEGTVTVTTDEIANISIICLDHEAAGRTESRQVISVSTSDGTERMLRRYLAELVELQDGYRQANGAYAADLAYMGFHLTRHPVPVELSVIEGGWTASASTSWSDTVCRVAIGTAAVEGTQSGRVECSAGSALITSASPSERHPREWV